MSTDQELAERIEAELRAAEDRILQIQRQARDRFDELQQRSRLFREIAEPFARKTVEPRLQKLLGYFKNGRIAELDERSGYHCACSFTHTPRFPATVTVTLGVTHDHTLERVLLIYSLEIMPVFLQYDKSSQVDFAIDEFNPEKATCWVDDRVVQFVQTYLQLEFADQYQQENLVTDPVGSERFSRIYAAAELDHQGKTYYFTTQANKEQFAAKPERYVTTDHAIHPFAVSRKTA